MAFVLTPAYHVPQYSPFGVCSSAVRPVHRYRSACQPRRVQVSPWSPFFSQFDELLSELDHQAQIQAHCAAQRQAQAERRQRKRALRAKFEIGQTEEGWRIDGELHGFDQENLSIDVTNDHTVKIAGNTKWHTKAVLAKEQTDDASGEKTLQVATEIAAASTEATIPTVATDSDTESHKSHQPTVEDDFEDLGAETASLRSTSSVSSTTSVHENRGEEQVAADAAGAKAEHKPTEKESESQQERVHGSFERTFTFPARVDAANVRASFKDGALTIIVPRAPEQEVKRIAIQ